MKRLILIDGNSLMYRAYYGLQASQSFTNSKGVYTNATYAFAKMINTLLDSAPYDAILVAFDAGKETFRHSIMADYKAGRSPMPDEMRMQIAYIKEFLDLKNILRYELPQYEADDIIGTMAKQGEEAGYHVDIYSGDKDLLQLISKNTTVHLTKRGISDLENFDETYFFNKYGIEVSSFVDLKGLMGDKSDNIPGVPGIGEKKALKYLTLYKNIDGIIEHLDEIKGADNKKLTEFQDQAKLCRKMATILREAPLEVNINDTVKKEPHYDKLIEFYKDLEFHSFLKELETPKIEFSKVDYKVATPDDLDQILLPDSFIYVETSNYNYHKYPLLALVIGNSKGIFIIESNLLYDSKVKTYLEDKSINKNVFDYKRIYVSLRHFNIETKGVGFDLLLGTYILNPKATKGEFKYLTTYYGDYKVEYEEEIYNKGAKRSIPNINILYPYLARKMDISLKLMPLCISKLNDSNQLDLLTNIEIPLSYVLGKLEYRGLSVDLDELDRQDLELSNRLIELTKLIYNEANKEFNINSPKQLAQVLFVDLEIPYPANSKKGYSTDISILEQLTNFKIIEYIIEYRQLTKLYSSYIKGLSEQIFADGKVHTIFEQALTETGRLSSIEPNLQNIPIKTAQGALIRKMFVPSNKNNLMYSADYSQIELRVLASMAHVKNFIEAFNNNVDVHTATAREIFGHEDITSLERRKAKAVNFGIVYGISPFGLAKDIDTSVTEAKEFIEHYKAINPEITLFTDKLIDEAKEQGYVSTIMNRRRYIPELKSSNFMEREFGKRVAMNAPIQGSAADIIKIAMIKIQNELEERNLKSEMLVQVHDELVFEVPVEEKEVLEELVIRNMTNALKLDVKLDVEGGFGNNWFELK